MYCLITGRPPFEGDDLGSILRDVQQGIFPPPRKCDATIDRPLESICLKAMALQPEARYESARALSEDVERWLADEPVTAYHEPPMARLARWGRRHLHVARKRPRRLPHRE